MQDPDTMKLQMKAEKKKAAMHIFAKKTINNP